MMENKSHMWGIEDEENRWDVDKNTMAYYFDWVVKRKLCK